MIAELRGSAPIAMYRVDATGIATQVAEIDLLRHGGCVVSFIEPSDWPLEGREGVFDGIPFFLDDMRAQGFMGKQFAQQHAIDLRLPVAPGDWSDDHILRALTLRGADQVGNYIIGEEAYCRFLSSTQEAHYFFCDDEVERAYPMLADQALAGNLSGSLVGGEFLKFTAKRQRGGELQHVIVKFSRADDSPGSQRWSDLLVCEHVASCILSEELGVETAQSSIYQMAGQTFLEVVRFDRHGAFGRSPICSWANLNAGLIGLADDPWPRGAALLHQEGLLGAAAMDAIERVWHFGRLIGNTDMHDANLSFAPGLAVAPIYDMLPMRYAPQRGIEVRDREYMPLPVPLESQPWAAAARAARVFWQRASQDERISAGFRTICQVNGARLASVMGDWP